MGSPSDVKVGPGLLYIAPAETTPPVDLTTPWAVAWVPLGYTEEGHAFTHTPNFEGIEVAEEKLPIRYEETGATEQLEFAAAEITARNFQIALNGGTLTTGTGIVTFEPPAADAIATRVAIGWESQDHTERWVWKRCLQTGAVEVGRRKAPAKATIPMAFQVELPLAGGLPFVSIFEDAA